MDKVKLFSNQTIVYYCVLLLCVCVSAGRAVWRAGKQQTAAGGGVCCGYAAPALPI